MKNFTLVAIEERDGVEIELTVRLKSQDDKEVSRALIIETMKIVCDGLTKARPE